jgi:hypothetical protein
MSPAAEQKRVGPLRRFWQRPMSAKLIALLSAALLIEMVFPWQRPCQIRPTGSALCGRVFAWEGSDFGVYAMVLAAAILIWELLPILIPRLSMRGLPTAIVTAILGVLLAICVLVKLIEDNENQTGWAWVGFGLSLAIMIAALIRVRFRWEARGKPKTPAPAPSATPEPPATPTSSGPS